MTSDWENSQSIADDTKQVVRNLWKQYEAATGIESDFIENRIMFYEANELVAGKDRKEIAAAIEKLEEIADNAKEPDSASDPSR